ncbi:MAG: helix-turn-helix domain-containing protein [Roseiarcus sp.]
MDVERHTVDSHRALRLVDKMRDRKAYRDSYVASFTRQFLSRQMREFRGKMSQKEFGEKIDKQQTIVSRLEDPNYGKWTLQTLFDVASKLDITVLVRFVDFPSFLRDTIDRSRSTICPEPYDQQKVDDLARAVETESHSQALAAFYQSAESMLKPDLVSNLHTARAKMPENENSTGRRHATPVPVPPLANFLRAA